MCRVMSGLGVGGSVPSLWTIATEILPIRRRGLYLTIVAWFSALLSFFCVRAKALALTYSCCDDNIVQVVDAGGDLRSRPRMGDDGRV